MKIKINYILQNLVKYELVYIITFKMQSLNCGTELCPDLYFLSLFTITEGAWVFRLVPDKSQLHTR